ncbi:hypothetical protein [Haloferula sp. A504]|uniref:hypothetical protein n=1 Tax=Haloferula sp. A504 TaxID=3373601 RepID=UPI0031C01E65|nr:hypothetical protein [Verrucomicrobiaceae bacterium E54]
MVRLLLVLLISPAAAVPATVELAAVTGDPSFNQLQITVDPGFGLTDSDVSQVTGNLFADLEVDPLLGQVSEMTLRNGEDPDDGLRATDVSFSRSVILVGGYSVSGNGLAGEIFTPSPPGVVTPGTGEFDASQYSFLLDQGTLAGSARIFGTTTLLDQVITPAEPITGPGAGTGTVLLTFVEDAGPFRTYAVLLTLPVTISDTFVDGSLSVDVTASGTLRAEGIVQVPRSEYVAWTLAEGIPGADPQADINGDGIPNALAWAYGLGKDDDAGAWRPAVTPGKGFEIPLPPGGIIAPVRVRVSQNLGGWTDLPVERISGGQNPLPAGSTGTITVSGSGAAREFLRLEVEE